MTGDREENLSGPHTKGSTPAVALEPFLAAMRRRDTTTAAAYVAEDVRVTGMTLLPLRGRAAWYRYIESFWRAFPDLQTELVQVESAPDRVTITERIQGTQRGPLSIPPLPPVPPTGRRISVGPNRVTFHLKNGVVVAMEGRMQRWQFVRQIGLWPFVLTTVRALFARRP